ncbi:MAG: hypothetical protein WBL27_12545 [Salinimicrobium sp.]
MPEPKIICGPILRRVEKKSVSVWVACKNNYRIFLKVYRGKVKHDTTASALTTTIPAEAITSSFGNHLWITVVTAKFDLPLQEGEIYSYDISFRSGDIPADQGDLKTDGFLEEGDHSSFRQLPLGYAKDFLPTFSLPSEDPAKLFIAHASCRKMHGHGLDALANMDEKIGESIKQATDLKPYERPQQLFLTGDQIYADDVPTFLLYSLGRDTAIVGDEILQVQKNGGSPVTLKSGNINFPPLLRGPLVQSFAGFTSGSAHNHLLSFWEFAGTYLCYWNLRSWNEDLYTRLKEVKSDNTPEKIRRLSEKIIDGSPAEGLTGIIPLIADNSNLRDANNEFLFTKKSDKEAFEENPPGDKRNEWRRSKVNKVKGEISQMIPFLDKLPAVSRVLANVASYMIFDDHEVTDDWNLTKGWVESSHATPLGKDIIRNALMAYTIFQDWGNTPDEYVAIGSPGEVESTLTAKTKLLRHISEYGSKVGRAIPYNLLRTDHLAPIETALGLNNNASSIKWHFNVDTGPTKTYVLDTRTRRHYASDKAPPGLIAKESLTDQIPDSLPNPSAPFVLVVSPAPVLALQSFEELIQPAASQFIEVSHKPDPDKEVPEGMAKFDYESWGFHTPTFENFVQRCSNLKKVIILSGDVHYGFSSALDFWEGGSSPKSRIVQLTSSALKNEDYGLMHLYRSAMVQKLLTGIGDKLEKLVWKNAVISVSGKVSTRNRQRLRKKPAVLPVAGWQPGATVSTAPDYRYRISVMSDESDRSATDPLKSEINLSESTSMKNGYNQIVERHQEVFISGVHRRMVWPANIGMVKFTANGNNWTVRHEFIFTEGERITDTPKPAVYLKHEIPLVASGIETTQPELT